VARIVIEDAVLFILMFYIISSAIFAMPIFDSLTPGQRYNSSTSSFESYTKSTSSILGNSSETQDFVDTYNNLSIVNAGAMINPLDVVAMVGAYVQLLISVVSSTMLFYILSMFMGDALAHIITFTLNLMIFIVGVRVITGRIRWD